MPGRILASMTNCQECQAKKQQALTDDLHLAVLGGQPMRTNTIDQIPPWRARLIVSVALLAGATLEHGDTELFDQAARAAGRQDVAQTGWWRRALGLEPQPAPYVPPAAGEYRPPPGWTVVRGPA